MPWVLNPQTHLPAVPSVEVQSSSFVHSLGSVPTVADTGRHTLTAPSKTSGPPVAQASSFVARSSDNLVYFFVHISVLHTNPGMHGGAH